MLATEVKFGEVKDLASEVEKHHDNVSFKHIFGNDNGGVSLLSFREGQSLAEHQAAAEVMVYVVSGRIRFTMLGSPHTIKTGEFMLMGESVRHSVVAEVDSVVMLVKIKP